MSDWNGKPEDWGAGHYRDVPTCELVRLVRERQVRDLERSLSDPGFPYYYSDEAADRVITFLSLLRQFEGQWYGQPLTLMDWQEWDVFRPLFGWLRRENNLRRFRTSYVEVAKGNGKSIMGAGVGSYLFVGDREYAAQVYSAATMEEQSRIVWGYAKKMMELSPELSPEIKAYKTSLFNELLGSIFRPLGRDSKTKDGLSGHGIIIDELHAHPNGELRDNLSSSRRSRRQPLLFQITTAGHGTETVCKKESDFARRIIRGELENENYFAYICTVDDPDKWEDENEARKANPNWGISVNVEQFRIELEEARQSPVKENEFKTKRLNIWTEQATRWINMTRWRECGGPIDWSRFKGKRCFAGGDLGLTRDISAFAFSFLGDEGTTVDEQGNTILPPVYTFMKFWVPEVGLYERYKRDGVHYPLWRDRGWITCTPGETTRNDFIRRDLNLLAEEFEIAEVAMDQAHGSELMQQLADDGFTVVKHHQSKNAMNFPCRALENLIIERRLRHGDNEVLTWMASNVAVEADADERIKIVKDKSGDRVDGMTALVMSVGRLLIAPAVPNFIYNNRGMYVA